MRDHARLEGNGWGPSATKKPGSSFADAADAPTGHASGVPRRSPPLLLPLGRLPALQLTPAIGLSAVPLFPVRCLESVGAALAKTGTPPGPPLPGRNTPLTRMLELSHGRAWLPWGSPGRIAKSSSALHPSWSPLLGKSAAPIRFVFSFFLAQNGSRVGPMPRANPEGNERRSVSPGDPHGPCPRSHVSHISATPPANLQGDARTRTHQAPGCAKERR